MKIKILMLTLSLFSGGVSVFNPAVFAKAPAVVEANNTICPVSGEEVSGQHFVEYQGKRYALCCPHCEKEFKKDPEKFIARI